jgi:hypothetical protein
MTDATDRVERMVDLVRTGEITVFVRRAHDFEPADLADVLSALDEQERLTVVQALPVELSSQARSWRTTTRRTSSASWSRRTRSGSFPKSRTGPRWTGCFATTRRPPAGG